jgi:hypothetical protein
MENRDSWKKYYIQNIFHLHLSSSPFFLAKHWNERNIFKSNKICSECMIHSSRLQGAWNTHIPFNMSSFREKNPSWLSSLSVNHIYWCYPTCVYLWMEIILQMVPSSSLTAPLTENIYSFHFTFMVFRKKSTSTRLFSENAVFHNSCSKLQQVVTQVKQGLACGLVVHRNGKQKLLIIYYTTCY